MEKIYGKIDGIGSDDEYESEESEEEYVGVDDP
jgi:hypothetical protein